MAHPQVHGFILMVLGGWLWFNRGVFGWIHKYTIHRSLYWRLKEKSPCPSCPCDCSTDFALIPIVCGKHELATKVEMEKDIIALMSQELSMQKTVANETLQQSDALLTSARRVSSRYQKEAEKCTAGMEICEEARARAEALLAEELRASEVWERRARELGWKDRRLYS